MRTNGHIKLDPARSVIELFTTEKQSGCAVIAESLGISYSSVYRWQVPKERDKRGLDGRVPGQHYRALRGLAASQKKSLSWAVLTGASIAQETTHGTQ